MAGNLNVIPNYPTQLTDRGVTSKDWFFFWSGLYQGLPPQQESAVTLGASPYTYSAPRGGFLIVNGGTVTVIAFSRDGTTFYTTGLTAGVFPVCSADQIRITYAVAPTVTFVPT